MKRPLRALSLALGVSALVLLVAMPAQARIQLDALGGEVLIEGFLSSEARARMGNDKYLTTFLQRLQVEASVSYTDVGIFDELSFVTVMRPEFDAAHYLGDSLTDGHVGNNADRGSYMGDSFTFAHDPVGFGGFDGFFGGYGATSTGGIGKIVTEGFQNPSWLAENFGVSFNKTAQGGNKLNYGNGLPGSAFPHVTLRSDMELNCIRCQNLDDDALDVAMGNTGSNGRLYPFRELYADAIVGDWWIRVGKQQVVWGKTDFFRLQDVVNPVDFGQHFFYDAFEDIRIPQWIASIQWKAGSIGPLNDNAFQVVWNFDEFQQVGLGSPTAAWAHPFAKDVSTFAIFNEFFSAEPCVGLNTMLANQFVGAGMSAQDVCGSGGPLDSRYPSGFGQPVGLSESLRPEWDIDNTEAGFRWEFRLADLRFAVSEWYGWQDVPVVAFHSVNVPTGLLGTNAGKYAGKRLSRNLVSGPDRLIFDLVADKTAGAGGIPVEVMDPTDALRAIAGGWNVGTGPGVVDPLTGIATPIDVLAREAMRTGNNEPLWRTGSGLGGQTHLEFKQSHTTGLAMDYFESFTGLVFRIESSITWDELVENTNTPTWTDESDVMRWSFGLDRPTFIKFLNKDRTFFLSQQIFDTWYWDHEGTKHTGMPFDEHNFIYTFFFQTHYKRDTIIPLAFFVWEEASNSYVVGANTEWLIDNHWSVKGGMHMIWGGENNRLHASGAFTSFIEPAAAGGSVYPYQNGVLGIAREGIGGLRNNDEIFFQLKYQF